LAKNDTFARGLFLFDQDTDANETALHHLIESFTILQDLGQLGLVAGYPKRSNGIPYRMRHRSMIQSPKPDLIAVDFAPSSFSLIPLSTLTAVGEFQEDFFIDYIDCDFCVRCWQQHLPVFIDTRATFLHRVGLGDVYIGNKLLIPIAIPFRHYYLMRNMILSGTRANSRLLNIVKDTVVRIAVVFVIGIYTRSLFKRLKYAARGITDGIRGKSGRLKKE
jgi:rhamnosyltransferase